MIVIKLKEAKLAYERRIGRRCTWVELAKLIGIPKDTLIAMANRKRYNTTLKKIGMICDGLDMPVADLLERHPDSATRKSRPKMRRAARKTSKNKG